MCVCVGVPQTEGGGGSDGACAEAVTEGRGLCRLLGWPHSVSGSRRGRVGRNEAARRPTGHSKQGLGSRERLEEHPNRWQGSNKEGMWLFKSTETSEGLSPARRTLARDFKPNITGELY